MTAALLVGWVWSALLTSDLSGHVPVPESVLNPQSAPEAWNVLRLASANMDRLVREGRLEEVPDQASLCPPALRLLARLAEPTAKRQVTAVGTVRAGSAINSLAQSAVAGDRAGAYAAMVKWHAALDTLASGEDARIVQADVFFCPMHPDVLDLASGASCPKCGMPLRPRRIPYSFVYAAPPGAPSMTLTTKGDGTTTAGQRQQIKLRLAWKDGTPVTGDDLLIAHTQRIHLLIIDPTLEDYHHEHPTPTGSAGEYEFEFTPEKTSAYRIFADVVPVATGIQEYIMTDLPGPKSTVGGEQPTIRRDTCLEVAAGNLRFQMTIGESAGPTLRAGQTQALRVMVTENDGQPTRRLEPVMNAFAHLVGFYEDGQTVVHLHPVGLDVEDPAQRGGPSLEFRLYPPKAGFLRLYCQVSIEGTMIYAPFGLNVLP
ncbi:MAG: hypothetical protein INR62_02875 [Rhodospirillales bacterium]|nr:hypothetical protein [Acetobacter sp.]